VALQFANLTLNHGFGNVVEQAKATDKALCNFSLSDVFGSDSPALLELPKLGVNPTQDDRFKFDDKGSLPVLVRDITRRHLHSIVGKPNESFYVSGPQGIGKSYALYTCACALRLQRDKKVRVTYIQSCREWVASHTNNEYIYILNELCETFQEDDISGKTIVEWSNYVMGGTTFNKVRDHRFRELKVALDTYVDQNKIHWISIFDQENGLYKQASPEAGVYPFKLIETFSSQVGPCLFLVFVGCCRSHATVFVVSCSFRSSYQRLPTTNCRVVKSPTSLSIWTSATTQVKAKRREKMRARQSTGVSPRTPTASSSWL
jgi:hypothetical protein